MPTQDQQRPLPSCTVRTVVLRIHAQLSILGEERIGHVAVNPVVNEMLREQGLREALGRGADHRLECGQVLVRNDDVTRNAVTVGLPVGGHEPLCVREVGYVRLAHDGESVHS